MSKIKEWLDTLIEKENKINCAYFTCNKEQSYHVRFLLNSENLTFLDLINSLEIEINDNEEKGVIIQGKISNILKFINAMRIKFQIAAFQEYIDVSRINV